MQAWSAAEVADFLRNSDLEGVADVCFRSGMNGADLLMITEHALCTELRLTQFAANKVRQAKHAFLHG